MFYGLTLLSQDSTSINGHCPARTSTWHSAGLMLSQCRRRWPNTKPTLDWQCWLNTGSASQTVAQHWGSIWLTVSSNSSPWNELDDTALCAELKFEFWRFEAQHATCRPQRPPTTFNLWGSDEEIYYSFEAECREWAINHHTLAWQ